MDSKIIELLDNLPGIYYKEFLQTLSTKDASSFYNVLEKHHKQYDSFLIDKIAKDKKAQQIFFIAICKLDPVKALTHLYSNDKQFVEDYKDFITGVGDENIIRHRLINRISNEPAYKQKLLSLILSND